MNILFIHEVDWLRKVVFEIHTLAEMMSLAGHRVYAIDYESMWVRDNLLDFGSLKTRAIGKVGRAYPEASVELIRPGFIKIPVLSRLSAAFTHYSEIQRTIRDKEIDAVVLYSVPTNGLQTIRLAKKLDVPVVFRSIDILGELTPSALLAPVTRMLEKKVYSKSDLIMTISPKLTDYVMNMGAKRENVKLLPLGVDTRSFRPDIDTAEVREKWGLGKETPVIVFIGTLFDFSGLDIFIRRFHEILESVPEARLLIVGDGPQHPALGKIITEEGLDGQITITGFQPYETMPAYMNLAAVLINTFLITDATRDIFPGKIVQYQACGRPSVITALPGVTAIVQGEEQGIVYTESPADMPAKIVPLLESEERCRTLGQAALNYVQQVHSYDKIVQQLESELIEIIDRKKDGISK